MRGPGLGQAALSPRSRAAGLLTLPRTSLLPLVTAQVSIPGDSVHSGPRPGGTAVLEPTLTGLPQVLLTWPPQCWAVHFCSGQGVPWPCAWHTPIKVRAVALSGGETEASMALSHQGVADRAPP